MLIKIEAVFFLKPECSYFAGADPATANIHIPNLFIPETTKYNYSNDAHWVWYHPQEQGYNRDYSYTAGKLFDVFKNASKEKHFEQMGET